MANLSSKTGFTPVQTQVSIPSLNVATNVQDFAAYDAQELTGFVYVDATADLRCSVKVMVVKNGAGTYEVASVDLAGDNYASAPLVAFSMSGSILRATLPAGIPGFAGTAYIKYQLNAPALGGQFPLTVDGSNVTSATTSAKGVITLKAPTQTKLTSGSGTYTVPAGVLYLKVKMVGGGGGGAGATAAQNGSSAGNGGATTFGSSFLTANGGGAGNNNTQYSGGGTATIGAGAVGLAFTGAGGSAAQLGSGTNFDAGAPGGGSFFSGGGAGGGYQQAGQPGATNTGAGGGGGGGAVSTGYCGGGGGAGGFIDALISTPGASYTYSVGAGGTAGTGAPLGGAGGSGIIVIDEYYY